MYHILVYLDRYTIKLLLTEISVDKSILQTDANKETLLQKPINYFLEAKNCSKIFLAFKTQV